MMLDFSTPIILFDIDGTITEPRRLIKPFMISALCKLSEKAHIGLVTGSPVSLIVEQLGPLFENAPNSVTESMDLLPCNGTQRYYWDADESKVMNASSVSMRDKLGDDIYQRLLQEVQKLQAEFADMSALLNIPLCGNFIDYRESLLNWCPIGRCANFDDRNTFIKADAVHKIRDKLIVKLRSALAGTQEIVIKYGGQTSFDIFPAGWDKTFCLNEFGDAPIWFVGDSCHPGGNDFELFEELKDAGRSFVTHGPEETVKIINDKIMPQVNEYLKTSD